MTVDLRRGDSLLRVGPGHRLYYALRRALPPLPCLTWRDRLLVWRRLLRPLPAEPDALVDRDYFRAFEALKRLHGAHTDGIWVTIRIPGRLGQRELAQITKDMFCEGAVYDVTIGWASLRDLQDTRRPAVERLRCAPTAIEVRAVAIDAFARITRTALEHLPQQRLATWAGFLAVGGWQVILRYVWLKKILKKPGARAWRWEDLFPAGPWATWRQTLAGIVLEAQARDLLPLARQQYAPEAQQFYRWRWPRLSGLLHAALGRFGLP